jgi:hypothetical protein
MLDIFDLNYTRPLQNMEKLVHGFVLVNWHHLLTHRDGGERVASHIWHPKGLQELLLHNGCPRDMIDMGCGSRWNLIQMRHEPIVFVVFYSSRRMVCIILISSWEHRSNANSYQKYHTEL